MKLPSASMGIAVEKVGRLFWFCFPASHSMTKVRTLKLLCDIFICVQGTPRFLFYIFVDTSPFPMVVLSKHSEDWLPKILADRLHFAVVGMAVARNLCVGRQAKFFKFRSPEMPFLEAISSSYLTQVVIFQR